MFLCGFIVGLALAFVIILYFSTKPDGTTLTPVVKEENPAGVLLSPIGIQRQLVELGYDIKLDGKLGPETMSAWNKAYGRQCHIKNMRKAKK